MQAAHTRKQSSGTAKLSVKRTLSSGPVSTHIYGKVITVYNDHKPFVSIYDNSSSKPPTRIEQWAFRFQPYQITIKYQRV